MMTKRQNPGEKYFKSIFFLHMQIRMFIVPVFLLEELFKESGRLLLGFVFFQMIGM